VSRLVNAADMRDIAKGATFLGAGGGGSLDHGLGLVDELEAAGKAQATVAECSEMGESDWAATLAGIGSPKTFQDNPSFPEGAVAFRALCRALAAEGRDIKFLIPVEVGGLNTIIPLCASAMEGIPLVDADGCGRAVPELSTLLYGVYGIPAAPIAMAGMNQGSMDSVLINLGNPNDSVAAENIARHVAIAYGMRGALCTYPVNRSIIETCLVPGSLTLVQKIGKALGEARSLEGFSSAVSALTQSRLVLVGKITKIESKVEGGFDFGKTFIEGLSGSGEPDDSLIIDVKNENILARNGSGQVIGTVPDLISLLNVDTMTPLSNADTVEGQTIAVFAIRAHDNWYRTPQGFGCWKPLLTKLGHDGGYVPFA
jgi:DUF917 family protein